MPERRPRLAVLASGSGSNLQAILDASLAGQLDADVVCVVTNRPEAYALTRAEAVAVATAVVEPVEGEARADYDARLADTVGAFEPDVVVLAGWMRLLSMNFLSRFPDRVINLHPALPGELAGTHAIERAWAQAMAGERTNSGVMVHLVPDEGVDDGPVLGIRTVPIDRSGTMEAFATSVHAAEHELLVETLAEFCGAL